MPPGRHGLASLEQAVEAFMRSAGLDARRGPWPVYRAFTQALGSQHGGRARPVRFKGGELTVEVDSAALLQELAAFTGEACRRKANEILGQETIRKLAFKPRR